MGKFEVQQIDHVELFVPDRYEAARWYQEVLGHEIIPEFEFWAEDENGPLMISSNGGSLNWHSSKANPMVLELPQLINGSPSGSAARVSWNLSPG